MGIWGPRRVQIGGLGVKDGSWIWCEVVLLEDEEAAQDTFSQLTADLAEAEECELGDEAVSLSLEESGLVAYLFRVDNAVAIVGSLAEEPEDAPSPESVLQAAHTLIAYLPRLAPAHALSLEDAEVGNGLGTSSQSTMTTVTSPLRLPDGRNNGTIALNLEADLISEQECNCTYVFKVYLKRITLGEEDGDGWGRGAGDVFVAGVVNLPCGTIQFITGEVGDISANSSLDFGEPGRYIGELRCERLPCWQDAFAYSINVLVRDNDTNDLIDILKAVLKIAAKVIGKKAEALVNVVQAITDRHRLQDQVNPPNPLTQARNIRGDDLGEGTASGSGSLPAPDIQVRDHTTCKMVVGNRPENPTHEFGCTDEQVVSWLELSGICRGSVELRWEWWHEGERRRTHQVEVSSAQATGGVEAVWDTLSPIDCELMMGAWQVKFYVNGELKATDDFTISLEAG